MLDFSENLVGVSPYYKLQPLNVFGLYYTLPVFENAFLQETLDYFLFGTLIPGTILYFALAALMYAVEHIIFKSYFFPNWTPKKGTVSSEIFWSVYTLVGNAVLITLCHSIYNTGYIKHKLFYDYDDIPKLIISTIAFIAFVETGVYWAHRWLHTRWAYKYIHVHHHRFKDTTSFAGFAFHPLDSFAQNLPYHVAIALFPVHFWVYYGLLFFAPIWAICIHDRYSWFRIPTILYCGHHTVHHEKNKWNYGNYTTIWDILCKTYYEPAPNGHPGISKKN